MRITSLGLLLPFLVQLIVGQLFEFILSFAQADQHAQFDRARGQRDGAALARAPRPFNGDDQPIGGAHLKQGGGEGVRERGETESVIFGMGDGVIGK